MSRSRLFLKWLVSALVALPAAAASDGERIVCLGGPVTEIVFALGAGDEVVAVDQSSLYPAAVGDLPQVGYVGALGAEGVLSVRPTRILGSSRMGPPATVNQLRGSGVSMQVIPNPHSRETLENAVRLIGEALDRQEAAEALWRSIDADLTRATELAQRHPSPRTVFLLGNAGTPMAAGKGTQADGLIRLAGAENLFIRQAGYKPVSEEALLESQPDVVLVAVHAPEEGAVDPRQTLRNLGLPHLAADSRLRVEAIDMSRYLSFGPRTGAAVVELVERLHESDSNPAARP